MATLFNQAGDKIQCTLCPHNCMIGDGNSGICGARRNNGGSGELVTYGVISGYALDPIEKKAIVPFLPGNKYSVNRILWMQHEV